MTTVFLSGSRTLGRLNPAVRERLDNIVAQGFHIVVGDANGADRAMQAYLHQLMYANVVVYCSGGKCRNNLGSWPVRDIYVPSNAQGRDFYTAKDRAMADQAEFGFVLWDGKSAGSVENVVELLRREKKVLLFLAPQGRFCTIATVADFNAILRLRGADDIASIEKKIGLTRSLKTLEGRAQVQITL